MSLTYQRSRITGAGLVAAQYDLTLERQTIMDNILFIPGIANPVSEINQLLFGQGQQGTFIAPSLTPSLISGSTFGTGVETLPDLSPRNNPFSQANSGNRAAWFREPKTGRRNLAVGTDLTVGAISGTPGTVPTGWTSSAAVGGGALQVVSNGLRVTGVDGDRRVMSQSFSLLANTTYAFTVICDIAQPLSLLNTFSNVTLFPSGTTVTLFQNGASIANSTVLDTASNIELKIVAAVGATAGSVTISLGKGVNTGVNAGDIVFRNFQVEIGSDRTAYQRVTTAFDVTESGQRDCFGVRFDGVDDFAQTGNTNLSNSPNATVFLAVRKRSDTTLASIISHNSGNDPSFQVRGPASNGGNSFSAFYRGSVTTAQATIGSVPSPIVSILTATFQRTVPLVSLQVDNGTPVNVATAIGGGNFANAIINLGSTSGLTAPCAVDVFGAIVVEGVPSVSTANRIRTILSRITPTVNL
jgi:hypothetical protein